MNNFNNNLLPITGDLSLVKIREYEIDSKNVAVISEEENAGWCVLTKQNYQRILNFFLEKNLKIENLDNETKLVITNLWQSNLLCVNNKCYSQYQAGDNEKKYPYYLLIKVTKLCNFCCSYCYDAGFSKNTVIDFAKVRDAINFLLLKNNKLIIIFHGGEPLIQFNLVRDIIEFTNNQLKLDDNKNKKVKFIIQTNGTLFTDEIISFLEFNNVRVGISLDGYTEKDNLYRKSLNSEISALKIFLNLYKRYPNFVKKYCGILSVVHQENVNKIAEFIEWLQNLEITSIYFNTLHLINANETNTDCFNKILTFNEVGILYNQILEKIKNRTIYNINVGNITNYVSTLLSLKSNSMCYSKGPCGASSEFLGINVDGKFQVCDCIPENIATIKTTELNEKIIYDHARKFVENMWYKFREKNCKLCSLFGLCGGGCIGISYLASKCKEVDMARCAASKVMYKELFLEIASIEKNKPIFDYYNSFQSNYV